jgi:hypothetical protein
MPEHWPRALLRAALREIGYDALGAPGLAGALRYRGEVPGRGAVGLVLVDQAALGDDAVALLPTLLQRHAGPAAVLLARTLSPGGLPEAARRVVWSRVVRRPVSIAELVTAVQQLVPLPSDARRPID